ncbi:MAG: Ig-like domain-containing protein [Propionibacteriaceae bacterium]|nr:Ig-like domain-containing protein [Propionibacteriaceae bacterium]
MSSVTVASAAPGAAPFTPDSYPRVDGSTATQPLGVAFQSLFTGQPVSSGDVVFNTTDAAYHNLINGDADLILVTSPSSDELAAAAAAGVDLEVIPVVDEGFVFLTNADNPVDSLSVDQIRQIYSGQIANWKAVGGPDQAITAYQRPANSGSQTGIEDLVMQGTPMVDAPTLSIPSMLGLVNQVAASFNGGAGSLGYSYYYFVTQMYGDLAANPQLSKIKLMGVDGVMPSADTIRSGAYPLHTAYYIVINKADAADSPARQLANAMLAHDGQQAALDAGYVPVDTTIPLPVPPPPDPDRVMSLDETYPVNPLTFTTYTEYRVSDKVMISENPCTMVTRVTVSGLADAALQDQINTRFYALQDELGGLTYSLPDGTTVDADAPGALPVVCDGVPWVDAAGDPVERDAGATPDYGQYTMTRPGMRLTGEAVANFSNVLSLQASFSHMAPIIGIPEIPRTTGLNVRLDTGADLTPADLFTTSAYVAGMIQLEAQASNTTCDEACATTLATTYLDDPNQPFSFTSTSAQILGVTIPFQSYWPQVAVYRKFASVPAAYVDASPASCQVVSTVWDASFQACMPTQITVSDFGTVAAHIPGAGGVARAHIPATAGETWTVRSFGPCSSMSSSPAPSVTASTGVGPADIGITVAANPTYEDQALTVCVMAINTTTRAVRFGEITINQDVVPALWIITVDPGDGATLTTGTPSFHGTLTTPEGIPLDNVDVKVTAPQAPASSCEALSDAQGAWSCTIDTPLPAGSQQIAVRAYGLDVNGSLEWGKKDLTVMVDTAKPAAPVILGPVNGQEVRVLAGVNMCSFMCPTIIHVWGTATPLSTVLLTNIGAGMDYERTTTDKDGNWDVMLFQWMSAPSSASISLTASTIVGDTRSVESSRVAFTVLSDASYSPEVTTDNAKADGSDANEVTVTMVDPFGKPKVTGPVFSVSAESDDPTVEVVTDPVTSANGKAVVRFTSTTPGAHEVWISVDGEPTPVDLDMSGSDPSVEVLPLTLTFVQAPHPPAAAVSLTLSSPSINVAYDTCAGTKTVTPQTVTATMTVTDASGAPVPDATVDLGVADPVILDGASSVVTDANGQAQATLTVDSPTRGAVVDVTATVANTSISASAPLAVGVLIPVPPAPGQIILTAVPTNGGRVMADGVSTWTLSALVVPGGCPAPVGPVQVQFTVTGDAVLSASSAPTDANSQASVTVTDVTPETVTVTVGATGNYWATEPMEIEFVPDPAPNHLSVSVTNAGRDYTFVGTGFQAGELVRAQINSTPVVLTPQAADGSGAVTFRWTAPADFPTGAHQIVLSADSGTVSQGFTVQADENIPSGGMVLGGGWSGGMPLALVGVLSCLIGIAVLIGSRRSRMGR